MRFKNFHILSFVSLVSSQGRGWKFKFIKKRTEKKRCFNGPKIKTLRSFGLTLTFWKNFNRGVFRTVRINKKYVRDHFCFFIFVNFPTRLSLRDGSRPMPDSGKRDQCSSCTALAWWYWLPKDGWPVFLWFAQSPVPCWHSICSGRGCRRTSEKSTTNLQWSKKQ